VLFQDKFIQIFRNHSHFSV